MSRLARALMLAATLAATTLAGLTAAAQAHPTSDDAARRQALAQERYYTSFDRQDNATQAALAQERYYGTSRPGEEPTAPAPPAEPNRPVVVLGAVAAALVLVALTTITATRTRRRLRVRQAA
jgi:hypothetical protein